MRNLDHESYGSHCPMGNWVVSGVKVIHGKSKIVIGSTLNTFMARPQKTVGREVAKGPLIAFKVAPPSCKYPNSRHIVRLIS